MVDEKEIFIDISKMIKRIAGADVDITYDTCLLHDLKITGDDAVELLDMVDEKFGIDWSGFSMNEYFPDEGDAIWWWMKDLFGFRDTVHKKCTVRDLVRAAKARRWRGR